jgi:glucose/arabinose dehydrogenase
MSNDPSNPGITLGIPPEERKARKESLVALHRKLQGAAGAGVRPAEVMVGAGDLLRRTRAAGVMEIQVESILAAVPREPLEAWLLKDPAVSLDAALDRALAEGGEAGLADDLEEQEMWASAAHEALMARDRAESARAAVDR